MGLFRAALEQQVITVPGEFFDVNPGKRRRGRASRFRGYARFSLRTADGRAGAGAGAVGSVVRARGHRP